MRIILLNPAIFMSIGCLRESFTIQNGPYHHQTHIALKNTQTEVRVTYEGCDYLCIPPTTATPDFIENTLVKIPSVSNQTLLRCKISGKDRLFYIHKTQRTVLEIHDIAAQQIEDLARKDSMEKRIDYQPEPIPLEHIQSIANLISYPPLFIHAKCAKNIEIKLTEEQRRLVLMMMDDNNISFRNTSYTYAFQAYLAKYMHESMLQKIELQFEAKHQHLETQTKPSSLWQSFKHSIKKTLWTSTKEKLTQIEAMQQWTLQLHQLSARFKAFDIFINNRGPVPQTTLKHLKDIFQQYQQHINSDIDGIIKNIAETDPKHRQKKRILTKLKQQLAVDMDSFEAQLIRLDNHPTKEQIERLVSITDRDVLIRSLGGFMQAQMTMIFRAGIQVGYKISNQRLHDVIQVPRLVAHLSDAKHLMLIKGQSIVEGPKDNDTYSAVPTAMLEATTTAESLDHSEAKWFSIKPYLKKWNPAAVDKILCLITGQATVANNRHQNLFYHWIVQPLKLLTSIFEIVFAIPRLGLVLSLGLIETFFFMLTWQHKSTELKLTYRLNQWIKQFYHDYAFLVAPLTYLKNSSWNAYRREDSTDNSHHQHVLDACTDHSGFCYNLFIYFTPQLISSTILDFFSAIFRQIMSIPRDISYLASYDQQAEDTFKQVQFRHQTLDQLNKLLSKHLHEAKKPRLIQLTKNPQEMPLEELRQHLRYHKGYIKYKNQLFYFDNKILQAEHFTPSHLEKSKQIHALMSRLSKNVVAIPTDAEMALFITATGHKDTTILDSYEPLSYCVINHISSPLDVFYDIMVTLSNGVVNPMFRKSPGIATFFFAISISTFATYLLPASALAWLKAIPVWLKYPAEQISLHFTGKSTTLGIQEQLVACFLEWKLGFFATEFGVELAHGHFEIFEPVFEEPEQIVLGLVGLISLGVALQYVPELPTTIHIPGLPEIPNYYFMIVNIFTEEAKSCADGTMFLTSIEYGFLGLKFAMLMHSMLSGSESHQEFTALQTLVLACGQKSFFKRMMQSSQKMGIAKWLQDASFTKELDQVLSDPDVSIFEASQTDLNSKIHSFATMLTRVVNQTLVEQNLHFEEHELNLFKTALAKQILAMPEFSSLNMAKNKVQKAFTTVELKTQLTSTHTKPNTLEEAYRTLCDAINMTKDPEQPLIFDHQGLGLIKEANQYYDYLDHCFENYNQALKREYGVSHPDYETLYLNKRPYLDVFFNKYCYQPSNNFIRSFLFFIYPLSVLSRGLKFLWATITNKPCMQHQIVKNFCKDMVIISQLIGPLARMMADFNLYMTGTLRGLTFLTTLPIALALYPIFFVGAKTSNLLFKIETPITPFSYCFEFLDDWICYLIVLHKTPELYLLRQLFVRASRVAGTNQDIAHAADKLYRDLDEIATRIPSLQTHHNNAKMLHILQPKMPSAIYQKNWSENALPKLFATYAPPDIEENDTSLKSYMYPSVIPKEYA